MSNMKPTAGYIREIAEAAERVNWPESAKARVAELEREREAWKERVEREAYLSEQARVAELQRERDMLAQAVEMYRATAPSEDEHTQFAMLDIELAAQVNATSAVAGERDAAVAERDRLRAALAKLGPRPHRHGCQWPYPPGACTCGADEHNAKVAAALAVTVTEAVKP